MILDFSSLKLGENYSRHKLAKLWGYKTFHPLARGVVTPSGDNKIVLFITDQKQESAEQYKNVLDGTILRWQGPTDHFAEQRMLQAGRNGDEIHAFFRAHHHSDFTYLGLVLITNSTLQTAGPTSFTFDVQSMEKQQ